MRKFAAYFSALAVLACMTQARTAEAVNCNALGSSCAWSSCTIDCSLGGVESQLRGAVALANTCTAGTTTTCPSPADDKTISFVNCTTAPITLQNNNPAAAAVCAPGDGTGAKNAICITGRHITIDGSLGGSSKINLQYYESAQCDPDNNNVNTTSCTSAGVPFSCCTGFHTGNCGSAAFVFKNAECNTIKNFDQDFFPEGMYFLSGNNNKIINVDSDHICDDSLSVIGGTNASITDCDFVGNTTGCGGGGVCGKDKAIQVNGGSTSLIRKNSFTQIGQPMTVASSATLKFECNNVQGDTNETLSGSQNRCQAVNVDAGTVEINNNKMDHCKYGIRVRGGAQVNAHDNVIENSYVSAFDIRCVKPSGNPVCQSSDQPRLRSQGNKVRRAGFCPQSKCSDCIKGAIVNRWDPPAFGIVDFGGGDCRFPTNSQPAWAGTTVSAGGNVFCQDDAAGPNGHLLDAWNLTEGSCPSSDQGTLACDSSRPARANDNCYQRTVTLKGKIDISDGCDGTEFSCNCTFTNPLTQAPCL